VGRPRKPTSELELSGAFRRNPKRKQERQGEPVVTSPLGPPEAYLNDTAKEIWQQNARAGPWLTGADRATMGLACHLMSEFRQLGAAMPVARMRVLVSALASLGFTPATRAKIGAPRETTPQTNPFESFKA
jgi:phage terminase small subunit